MQDEDFGGKLGGEIEIDETFIGGKARNMHKHLREQKITGTGGKDTTAVIGILKRGGTVRTRVVRNRKKKLLQDIVKEHVETGAAIFTDALKSSDGLDVDYEHQFVDHAIEYVTVEADPKRNLRLGRAIPSVSLSRRTGVPAQ